MDLSDKITVDMELHSVDGIRDCFANGLDPNGLYKGKPLIYELMGEYTRSPAFKDCVRAFVDNGLKMDDPALSATLCNDSLALGNHLKAFPEVVNKTYSFKCAYTPMHEATLLHICAEFNHVECAEVLVNHGANIDAAAGVDEFGFGAQTPIFHTVNQNNNQSMDMLKFFLEHDAARRITVPGLIWGKEYEWETLIPAVNPISYSMMGLLPQMHRNEKTINEVVSLLLKHEFGIVYSSPNVPNAYLKK